MAAAAGKLVWTGRIISIVISLMFLFSAVVKFMGGPDVTEGLSKSGIPESILLPLAILELVCTLVYLVPVTSVLGAILMTGYIGGIIVTHWRMGLPLTMPIILGLLVWLGLYLREPRLKELMPLRKGLTRP